MASIFIRTILIYVFLAISLKIMGKRQIGELEVNELVSTLVVSEVAALPVADPDIPLLNALLPVALIVCLEIIISAVKNKSEKLKRRIEGEPIFLVYRGKLQQKALCDNRMSVNELLCEMRMQEIGNIEDVYYAILEPNGKLSFFESPSAKNFTHALIVDTEIYESALKGLGYNEEWLKKQLNKHKAKRSEVFLMTVDDSGETYIIRKEKT